MMRSPLPISMAAGTEVILSATVNAVEAFMAEQRVKQRGDGADDATKHNGLNSSNFDRRLTVCEAAL